MKKRVKQAKPKKSATRSTKVTRIKTGIDHLDTLIGGGLIEKSITLVAGGAGSGKTIFAMQFLLEGLKLGESCIYLTFEEKKEKLYGDMAGFGWNFEKYENDKHFFYLEHSPEQVKALIEEGGGTIDQLISKKKVTRLVIDSVTSFYLLYQDELSRKEAGLALFELINKWGCTAVLTSQAAARKDDLLNTSLEFEADSIILLYHFRARGERKRALEILKMRGTSHSNKTMMFNITKAGIVVHPGQILKSS